LVFALLRGLVAVRPLTAVNFAGITVLHSAVMIIVITARAIAMIIVSIVIAVTVTISGDGVLRCGHQKHSGSQ
jgi:hypothetical protein